MLRVNVGSGASKNGTPKRNALVPPEARPLHNDGGMEKIFTLEQANRMLPLVRRIVEDAVRDYTRWQERVREFEVASLRSSVDHPDAIARELETDVQRLAESIDSYVHEIEQLGVYMKSINSGIVDFPGEIDGRPILFCWQLGENAVEFWHEIDSGFSNRHPLSSRMLPEFTF
jgi:hypothetical protein